MPPWRFIDTGPLDGVSNMAVDEALLRCFNPSAPRPVFRIYGWEPPALSLGRFQRADLVLEREKAQEAGVTVVRRITGGGVIYHADELTYSIVCTPGEVPQATSIKESFRVLTSFLIRFYRRLGLDPSYAVDSDPQGIGGRSDFCFAGRETYDIVINGRKIGGNAQRRLKDIIFQHGSIPLVNRAEFGSTFLRERPEGIGEKTTALRDLGITESVASLMRTLEESFADAVSADLRRDSLSPGEEATAATLRREKHADDEWLWQGKERQQ